jgi:hypothetical protein
MFFPITVYFFTVTIIILHYTMSYVKLKIILYMYKLFCELRDINIECAIYHY